MAIVRRDRETRSRRFFAPKHVLQGAAPRACRAETRADASCTCCARSNSTNTLATKMPAFPELKRGCFICALIRETRLARAGRAVTGRTPCTRR